MSVELSVNCSFVELTKGFVLQTGVVKNTTWSTYKLPLKSGQL